MLTVSDVKNAINTFAPFSAQCDWDNSGFLVGDGARAVQKIGFALDLTPQTLQAALTAGVDMLVTHHPVIFHAKKRLFADDPVYALAQHGIAAVCVHTPWDSAAGGVNDVLAALLELQNVTCPYPDDPERSFLRLGKLPASCSAEDFAAFAASKLQTTVRLADCGKRVATVAVCGGSAMELAADALAAGADIFVTGDAKHHELLDAVADGISVLAAGHFETERPSIAALKDRVAALLPQADCVLLSEDNPVKFFSA